MKLSLVIFGLFTTLVSNIFAQESDFQVWPQFEIGYNFAGKFKASVEEEIRLRENASLIRKELTDVGLSYKINKALRVSLKYRFELNWTTPEEKSWRNGLYMDILLRNKIKRFQLDYRLRFQSPKVETLSELSEGRELFINRHKAGLSYNIKGIPLTPVIEAEIFIPFARQEPVFIDEYRLWAGIDYAFNKRNSIGIKYGIQREINVSDPLTAYVIALKYTFDLN
jgi:long-subunit fatty acid transport protein